MDLYASTNPMKEEEIDALHSSLSKIEGLYLPEWRALSSGVMRGILDKYKTLRQLKEPGDIAQVKEEITSLYDKGSDAKTNDEILKFYRSAGRLERKNNIDNWDTIMNNSSTSAFDIFYDHKIAILDYYLGLKGLQENSFDDDYSYNTELYDGYIMRESDPDFLESKIKEFSGIRDSLKKALSENSIRILTQEKSAYDKRASSILFEHFRDTRKDVFLENIKNLLSPILSQTDGTIAYDFTIYNPCNEYLEGLNEDPEIWYNRYDEIISLPAYSNGLVDFDKLLDIALTIGVDKSIAISSKVHTAKGEKYFNFIDFDRSLPEDRARSVIDNTKGILVRSSNHGKYFNYHFYGTKLTDKETFDSFLQKISQIKEVGNRWPYLQKTQGFSLLRITATEEKPFFPEIII